MHDVGLPLNGSSALPGSIAETSEVGVKVLFGHLTHDFNDLAVFGHLVEDALDLIGGLILKVCEADGLLLGKLSRLLECLNHSLLLHEEVIDNVFDIGILQVLSVDQLIPMVLIDLSPIIMRLKILRELGPDVIHVEVEADFNSLIITNHGGLLEDEPVVVVAKGESDGDALCLLFLKLDGRVVLGS